MSASEILFTYLKKSPNTRRVQPALSLAVSVGPAEEWRPWSAKGTDERGHGGGFDWDPGTALGKLPWALPASSEVAWGGAASSPHAASSALRTHILWVVSIVMCRFLFSKQTQTCPEEWISV